MSYPGRCVQCDQTKACFSSLQMEAYWADPVSKK